MPSSQLWVPLGLLPQAASCTLWMRSWPCELSVSAPGDSRRRGIVPESCSVLTLLG